MRGGRSRGWTPCSRQNSSSAGVLSAIFWILRPFRRPLSESSVAGALCAMGDATRQKILACSSRLDVRMRACHGILQLVSIPRLRGHGASGPWDGLLGANAVRLPSGPSPSRLFLFLMIMVYGASLPRPPGIRIADTRSRRRAACSRRAAATRG